MGEKQDYHEIHGDEVIEREVKPFGDRGAHITAPKRWRGAKVKLVRVTDPDPAKYDEG